MNDQDKNINKDFDKDINNKSSLEEEIKKERERYNQLSNEALIEEILEAEKTLTLSKNEQNELKKDKDNWQDKYTRLQAEFENTQKRWEKSKDHLKNQSRGNILKNFLPLYDSFKNALKNEGDLHIIQQFFKQFMNILKGLGVEPMKVDKQELFDYNKHEALTTIENEDIPNNTIIDIIQDGVKLDKDILRYAKVIVSRKPKPKDNKEAEKVDENLKE